MPRPTKNRWILYDPNGKEVMQGSFRQLSEFLGKTMSSMYSHVSYYRKANNISKTDPVKVKFNKAIYKIVLADDVFTEQQKMTNASPEETEHLQLIMKEKSFPKMALVKLSHTSIQSVQNYLDGLNMSKKSKQRIDTAIGKLEVMSEDECSQYVCNAGLRKSRSSDPAEIRRRKKIAQRGNYDVKISNAKPYQDALDLQQKIGALCLSLGLTEADVKKIGALKSRGEWEKVMYLYEHFVPMRALQKF